MPLPNGYGFDSANLNVFAHGDKHIQNRYLGPSGVSLHPLQRSGHVSAASHNFGMHARVGAATWPGLGDGPPAGLVRVTFPPMVQIAGSGRDPRIMI